jgi:light-regulated signal transduction histidine kinase (bacteriophytochrome)
MRNMGTLSSMSVSIVVNGRLWGLISGHHATPRTVPYLIRSACDMLAKMMSTQLVALRTSERLRRTVSLHDIQRRVLTRLASGSDFLENLSQQMPELMQLADSSGVALVAGSHVARHGTTPSDAEIHRLVEWLESQPEDVIHTSNLSETVPWAGSIAPVASGLLSVRISSISHRYLLWFRPEMIQTVRWAGEPVRPGEARRMTPRNSFDLWKETVSGQSTPWAELEIESVTDFRSALTGISLRRAEEAIELGEARFQQLTSAMPARVFVCDDLGRLTYVNQRWPARTRTSQALWFDDLALDAAERDHFAQVWANAVAEDRPFEAEVRLHDEATGAERWNFVRAVPFQRAGQARAGWIGTFVDLTDSREREKALQVNEKLALSGRMTSVIAHEINNPLESITNLMYLLRSEVPDAGPASSYIAMVETELERISGITKQTLRWNREHAVPPGTFTAGTVVDDVLRLFSGKIRNRQVTATVTGDRATELRGGVGQIRQALANLISNAIDASPLGGSLAIHIFHNGTTAGFSVQDSGPGIPHEIRGRLFEPFFTTKGDLGNGLGLYITREILEQHQGRLEVTSEPGAGTTMTIALPV